MAHPLTDTLASEMRKADGNPTTLANGLPAAPAYAAWANAALQALLSLSERDGHRALQIELDAVGQGYALEAQPFDAAR